MKSVLAALSLFCWIGSANAALMTYDITVNNTGWFDSDGTPFDMPLSPTLTGSMTVDDTFSDINALVDFMLTTGNRTWTEADYVGNIADFNYSSGNLVSFGLNGFGRLNGQSLGDGPDTMYIFSNNTFGVRESATDESNACNGCVSFELRTASVPVPGTTALFGLALAGFGLSRKRKS